MPTRCHDMGARGLDVQKIENNNCKSCRNLHSIGMRPSVSITSLPNNPAPSHNKTQEVELDQATGGTILCIGARGLNITWGNDRRYWDWGHTQQGSRFREVGYLKNVCWLDVTGRIQFPLSPGTYTLSWRLYYRSEHYIDPLKFSLEVPRNEPVNTQCRLTGSGVRTSRHLSGGRQELVSWRWDPFGSMEVDVGEFSVVSEDPPVEVKFSMRETQSGNWKSGLYLDGIVIRPSVPITSIPRSPAFLDNRTHGSNRPQENGLDQVSTEGPSALYIEARGLNVVWGNDGRYWDWGNVRQGSRFREVAYLKSVCWLDITGRLQFPLSPGTYTLSWRLCYRSKHYIDPLKFSLEVTGNEPVNTQCMLTARGAGSSRHTSDEWQELVSWRWDPFGWMEVNVGEFSVASEDPPVEVKFSMRETQSGNWKSGLYLDGIVIRPSVPLTSIPRSPAFLCNRPHADELDQGTEGTFLYIEARALNVIWGNDGRYWEWGQVQQGSRSREVAYLKNVCWLEVTGRLKLPLSPGTYTLSWRLCYRLKDYIEPLRFSLEVTGNEPVHTQCRLTARGAKRSRHNSDEWQQLLSWRWDPFGWMEVDVGKFSVTSEDSQLVEVKLSMKETQNGNWKSGLYLDGIVIRPSILVPSLPIIIPSMPTLTDLS